MILIEKRWDKTLLDIKYGDGYDVRIHGVQVALSLLARRSKIIGPKINSVNLSFVRFGFYDVETEMAITLFQKAVGIPATGELNEITYISIFAAIRDELNSIIIQVAEKKLKIQEITSDMVDEDYESDMFDKNSDSDSNLDSDYKLNLFLSGNYNNPELYDYPYLNSGYGNQYDYDDQSDEERPSSLISSTNNSFFDNDKYWGSANNNSFFNNDKYWGSVIDNPFLNDDKYWGSVNEGSFFNKDKFWGSMINDYDSIFLSATNNTKSFGNGGSLNLSGGSTDMFVGSYRKPNNDNENFGSNYIDSLLTNSIYNGNYDYTKPSFWVSNSSMNINVDGYTYESSEKHKTFFSSKNSATTRKSKYDITVVYGANGQFAKKILGVVHRSRTQQIDASGEAIFDVIEFIAKDIIETDNTRK